MNIKMGQQSKRKRLKKIVKVQLSLFTTATFNSILPENQKRMMLVYSQDKEWRYEGPATPEFVKAMNGRDKAYFWATKNGPMLDLDIVTPVNQDQDW